jgi:hypothetical protein
MLLGTFMSDLYLVDISCFFFMSVIVTMVKNVSYIKPTGKKFAWAMWHASNKNYNIMVSFFGRDTAYKSCIFRAVELNHLTLDLISFLTKDWCRW